MKIPIRKFCIVAVFLCCFASSHALQVMRGQSSTLLPDGSILLSGGYDQHGTPVSDAFIIAVSGANRIQQLPAGLGFARAGHTATLLPDGTVFIFGGLGSDGRIVTTAELFDPRTRAFSTLANVFAVPRAFHTATVLTDGMLLLAGGIEAGGQFPDDVQLWDYRTRKALSYHAFLSIPREGHTATLAANGTVLISGGTDHFGRPAQVAEIFDPLTRRFRFAAPEEFNSAETTLNIAKSIPQDGAEDVAVDSNLAIRFTAMISVATANADTLRLIAPDGSTVPATVTPVESGRLVFVIPESPLQSGTSYTLRIRQVADRSGALLSPTSITFQTEGEPPENAGLDWMPNSTWTYGGGTTKFQELPPLQARFGITALSGQVLKLNGWPLRHVSLQVENRKVYSDSTGRFLLQGISAGHHVLWIDAGSANHDGAVYGTYPVGITILPGKTNVLDYTIWMSRLDTAHTVRIASPTTADLKITTPAIPGLELHLPKSTIIRDRYGRAVHEINITPIPLDKPPFPLPPNVQLPVYFTIQPGGAQIQVINPGNGPDGAQLVYPNRLNVKAGTRANFWNYDPGLKGWYIYGSGTVTTDGRSFVPERDAEIYEFTAAGTGPMTADPSGAPGQGCLPGPNGCKGGGDPVSLNTGQFIYTKTDLALSDTIPIALTRTYLSNDNLSRAFGIGSTHVYDMFLIGDIDPYTYQELVLPDGGRIRFDRMSPGTSYLDAVYVHVSSGTQFYGARLSFMNKTGGWNLTSRDGTTYVFPTSTDSASPACHALIQIIDRFGNQVNFTRTPKNVNQPSSTWCQLTNITSSNGRSISLTLDSQQRITQAQDNTGRTVVYAYDTAGRLSTVTDASNGVTTYTYDSQNRMLTIQDPRQLVYLTNRYDSAGRVSQQTQIDTGTYLFNYTPTANTAQTHFYVSPGGGGGGTSFLVNGCWDGASYSRYSSSCGQGYMPLVAQVDVTDPRGYVRRVVFNSFGYPTTDTHALGQPEEQTTTYAYYADNTLKSVTDPLGRVTSYDYDSNGNPIRVTRLDGTPNAVTTALSYEPLFNQLSAVTDPLNHVVTLNHDTLGNLTSVSDPLSHQTTFGHDIHGLLTSVKDALNNTTQMGYFGGDLVSIQDPLSNLITQTYDAAGRVASMLDAQGHTARYQYSNLNLVTQVTDPQGNPTSFSYDPNGNLLSLTDSNQHTTTWTYDNMDRVQTRTDPLLRAESYTYDSMGNLASVTDRKGQVTTFSYDPLGRLKFVGYNTTVNGGVTSYESTTTFTYDAGNRLTQAVDSAGGTITRTYDDLDRLTSETTPQGSVSYGYDAAGRRTSMTVAGQPQVTYTYDNADRLTQIAQGTSTVTFGYDNANRRTSLAMSNGVNVSYSYDNDSRVTGITYNFNATLLGNLTYSYDELGRRTQVGGSFAQTALPQPVASAGYDAANELTNWNGTTIGYDLNGNMLSDGANAFTWNARNQVASLNGVALKYDAFGRRLQNLGGTSFLYDGSNAAQELSGTTPTANLLSGGIDEIFSRSDSSGTLTPLLDPLGSTIALVDSSGNLVTSYAYEPFGGTVLSGQVGRNPLQYTGRENETNALYYYRARYYSTLFGRFLNEDPAYADFNFYIYANDDPVNLADPLGLDALGNTADVFAGIGDSMTFGGTGIVRRLINGGCESADTSSFWYKFGEYAETGAEIGLTLGSAALKKAAAGAVREVVYSEARQMTADIVRETGEQLHHINPLFGHPGGSSTLFPTGGLPAWLHSGSWNVTVLTVAEHKVQHLVLRAGESVLGGTLLNPALTAARATRNALAGRACGCE